MRTVPSPRARYRTSVLFAAWAVLAWVRAGAAADYAIHTFERKSLTDVYYSEGVGAGDLNRDGHVDIVYGPLWFAGPDFKQQREIYAPKPQNKEGYADHFFAWVYDFNGDGWNDVLTAGFPGTPAFIYENPHSDGFGTPWPKRQVFPQVGNESPQFVNIVGDERPELVCTKDGYYGYATFDPARPFEPWTFHPISDKIAPIPFGHGLGVGDVDGDGRMDILQKDGWFTQPESLAQDPKWWFNPAPFAPVGGADMYAYDVDGDGDNDIITSLAAHDFGLSWYEQVHDGSRTRFRPHRIMGDKPSQNRYGLVFTELHSVVLADIDGDGLKDIVTGKTYYSHHKQSPMWDAGAVVYWFRLVRGRDGIDWVPYKADGESGIGRQLVVHDINGDGLPDIAAGGMKGASVLIHRREVVDETRWRAAQPKPQKVAPKVEMRRTPPDFDADTGRVKGAIEAEDVPVVSVTGGRVTAQNMQQFAPGRWSGNTQLWWSGGKPGDRLELELSVPAAGNYDIAAGLTLARDYGIVEFAFDKEPLGDAIDLYHYPDVIASGEITLGTKKLSAGKHTLQLSLQGANAAAVRSYMAGVDYIRLIAR